MKTIWMKTIWKFELAVTDIQRVTMPQGATLLTAREQMVSEVTDNSVRHGEVPMLWAMVDPDAPKVERAIGMFGTGEYVPGHRRPAVYVGTAVCGPLVWHVFDGGEVDER